MTVLPSLRWLLLVAFSLAFSIAYAEDDENRPPFSDAGEPVRTVFVGDVVQLDGSASFDPDGDPLTYEWELFPPPGSMAMLDDPTAVMPTFIADVPGEYLVSLNVNDGHLDSGLCHIDVIAVEGGANQPPVADAGMYDPVPVISTVQLDGSGSSDPDGDALMYMWSVLAPDGSMVMLSDPMIVDPTFEATMVGTYTATLVVNDGTVDSDPSMALIEAFDPMTPTLSIGDVDLQPTDPPSFQFPVTLEGTAPGVVTAEYQVVIIDPLGTEFFNMQDGTLTFTGVGPIEVQLTDPPGSRFTLPPNDLFFCVFIGSVMPPEAAVIVDEVGLGIIRNNDPTDDGDIPADACDDVANPFDAPVGGGSTSATELTSSGDSTSSSASALGASGLVFLTVIAAWRRRWLQG